MIQRIHEPQVQVAEFHRAIGHNYVPQHEPDLATSRSHLRARLIMEEAAETAACLTGGPVSYKVGEDATQVQVGPEEDHDRLIGTIDGVQDLLVVTYGTAVEIGFNSRPFFNEVHRANMDKLRGPMREDGKQLKPEGWVPPDIEGVLERTKGGWQ